MKRTPLQLVIKLSFFCMDVCCSESKQQRERSTPDDICESGALTRRKVLQQSWAGSSSLNFGRISRACPLTSRIGHTREGMICSHNDRQSGRL